MASASSISRAVYQGDAGRTEALLDRAYCPACGTRRGVDMVAVGGTHRPYLICVNASCPDDSRTLDTAEAMAARREADLLDAAEYWQENGN